MDYKFAVTLVVNVVGLGFMAWQVRLMKRQMENLPSSRSARKVELEKRIVRKLYVPVVLMAGLVLLSWLPFVVGSSQPSTLPVFLASWGGALDGCAATVDTSGFVKASEKYRMFLVCHIMDPSVDELEDDKIAISKPFHITGGMVSILISYTPSTPIKSVVKVGAPTGVSILLLPKDQDGSAIRKLADVARDGGQILLPGKKLGD